MINLPSLSQVDILHPLANMAWEECAPLPLALRESTQCVLVKGQLCVGTEYTVHVASPDLKSWKKMVTCNHDFALASYDSQILTIGGLDSTRNREITDRSWIVNFNKCECLPSSLPPMLTKRHSASAVNIESAMSLVVAGGADENKVIDSVEVMLNGRWSFVQSLFTPLFGLRSVVHDDSLFFMGGASYDVYHCKVEDILQACANTESKCKDPCSLWSRFPSLLGQKSPVSFGKHLVVVGVEQTTFFTEIQAYSSTTQPAPWVGVADVPNELKHCASLILPTGEILVMGKESKDVFKGVLNSELL